MSRLANIIDVQTFNDLPAVDSPERTTFVTSGIAVRNALFDQLADAPGKKAELHFWKDLDPAIEQNYSNDNPADLAVPLLLAQGEMNARKAFMNQAWSESDLAAELASAGTAMRRIRARIDTYWARRFQRRIIAMATGVFLANVAQDGGDMVKDISLDNAGAAGAGNIFSRTAMVGAAFTMGDRFDGIKTMVVHSIIAQRMIDNDDIVYVMDSAGQLSIPTYLGRRIVIDDSMPVLAAGTSGFRYVSMLFGEAAFGYGDGSPEVPTEVDREALGGNGGGVENIISRKTWLVHPLGYNFTNNTVSGPAAPKNPAGISPTDSDLRLAANWDRIYDRKLLPLAFLVSNG